jgi:6-phosphogluconolactonase (cycloisomerase 2 family)
VFYVLNLATQQAAGFAFATGSTTPTAVTGSPYALGATPLAMAIAPNGKFLYISTGGGLFVYGIGTGGALTLLNNQQSISGDLATTIAVDSSGTWLLEETSGSGTLNAIPISTSTGLVDSTRTLQTVHMPNITAKEIAVSPANSTSPYVFVAMGSGGTAIIPFASGDVAPFGSVATIAVKNNNGAANAIAVDPTNRLLYVGETAALSGTQTGGMRVFTIGTSKIEEIANSPFATGGTGPSAILPMANFVYVANFAVSGSGTGNITGYSVTSSNSTYTLALVNTVNAGKSTVGLAEDSTSTYILALNTGGNPDLSTYTFDTTGKLTAGATAKTGTDPVQALAIVAAPQ